MAKDKTLLWEIGNKLTVARERAGMTQEKLADAIGMQSNTIHRYEAGEREMGLTTAACIANALHIPLIELIPAEYSVNTQGKLPATDVLNVFYQLDPEEQRFLVKQMVALANMKKSA